MTSSRTWGEFFDPHCGGGARWRPFRFRPPSCAAAAMGIEKLALYYYYANLQVTSACHCNMPIYNIHTVTHISVICITCECFFVYGNIYSFWRIQSSSLNIWSRPPWRCTCKCLYMTTSWNWNILRATGPLLGELSGHRWIPLSNASNSELWFFFFHLRLNKELSK